MAKIKRVQNDTAPNFTFSLARPDGTVPDLAGATVSFIMQAPSGAVANTGHQTCSITDEDAGEGYYEFIAGDLSETGDYSCDLQITYSNGQVETISKPVTVTVREEAA